MDSDVSEIKEKLCRDFPSRYTIILPEWNEQLNKLKGMTEEEKDLTLSLLAQLDNVEAGKYLDGLVKAGSAPI